MLPPRALRAVTALFPVVALAGAFGATSPASAETGQTSLSSNQLLIASDEPLQVTGSSYTECAGQTVTVSLLFRRTTSSGFGSFADAPRLSPEQVAVDSSGSFQVSLAAPAEFSGWLGYVAMDGACVKLAPQRLLADVESAVPLGSPIAAQLGLTATHGALVVIPAAAIRSYPILPDDTLRDPYAKLGDLALLGPDNRVCASTDIQAAALPSGDVVIDASACPMGVALNAVVGREGTVTPPTLLLSQAHPRDRYAVPLALVFPPPGTDAGPSPVGSGAVTPGAPDTGGPVAAPASASSAAFERSAALFVAAVLLAAGAGGIALAWRRRG